MSTLMLTLVNEAKGRAVRRLIQSIKADWPESGCACMHQQETADPCDFPG